MNQQIVEEKELFLNYTLNHQWIINSLIRLEFI